MDRFPGHVLNTVMLSREWTFLDAPWASPLLSWTKMIREGVIILTCIPAVCKLQLHWHHSSHHHTHSPTGREWRPPLYPPSCSLQLPNAPEGLQTNISGKHVIIVLLMIVIHARRFSDASFDISWSKITQTNLSFHSSHQCVLTNWRQQAWYLIRISPLTADTYILTVGAVMLAPLRVGAGQ